MRTILFLGCLLIAIAGFSQSTENAEAMVAKIANLYNKEDYKAVYSLLSPDFKTELSEAQAIAFCTNNLYTPFGKILNWQAGEKKDGNFNYKVIFEKGKIDLSFNLNEKQELTGMMWVPITENNRKKRNADHIATNNKRLTTAQRVIDSLARDYLANAATCGLSIGIVARGSTEMYFYGSVNKDTEALPGPSTIYEIGSITKTFTGTILAHAINEGKIKPDDDIRKYLPGEYPNLEYEGKPITVQDLANHTSGLARMPNDLNRQDNFDPSDPFKNYTTEMVLNYLKTVKLNKEPGTVSSYSNLGGGLLGIILERLYQSPLAGLYAELINAPLQLRYTNITVPKADEGRRATGYFDGTGKKAAYWHLGGLAAAGGLNSCLADMLIWLSANSSETNEDMKLAHAETFKDAKNSIGLHWILSATKDKHTIVWHNGGTGGFRSYCGFVKEMNIGVVVLSNTAIDVDYVGQGILKELKAEK